MLPHWIQNLLSCLGCMDEHREEPLLNIEDGDFWVEITPTIVD